MICISDKSTFIATSFLALYTHSTKKGMVDRILLYWLSLLLLLMWTNVLLNVSNKSKLKYIYSADILYAFLVDQLSYGNLATYSPLNQCSNHFKECWTLSEDGFYGMNMRILFLALYINKICRWLVIHIFGLLYKELILDRINHILIFYRYMNIYEILSCAYRIFILYFMPYFIIYSSLGLWGIQNSPN